MDREKLKEQLALHEGIRLKMYQDTVGKWTIGVGHNLSDKPISERAAFVILDDDMADAIDYAEHNFPWFSSLDDVRQRVIVDMVFNLGGKLKQFKTFLSDIERGDYLAASRSMLQSLWAKQVGNRALTLSKMMETGKDGAE